MGDIAISVEDLSKRYKIGQLKSQNFYESFNDFFQKLKGSSKAISKRSTGLRTSFWALEDISFSVNKGETVGIIGKNGAGKSTLLKILSRITRPTTGKFLIEGRVSSLLEVGTGFHNELSGRENIFLNGTILGMKRGEIKAKFDEIVDFSGVEDFLDTPVKHYSSGMKVRLAFSVAAFLEPEILIIDEVLAVGDADFQKKCLGKMEDVSNQGRTVLFVSHNLTAVRKLCSRGILLNEGKVLKDDKTEKVIDSYTQTTGVPNKRVYSLDDYPRSKGEKVIKFSRVEYSKKAFDFGEDISFEIELLSFEDRVINKDVDLGIAVLDKHGAVIYHMTNRFIHKTISINERKKTISINIANELRPGMYSLVLFLRTHGMIQDWLHEVCQFEILDGNPYNYTNTEEISGIIFPKYDIIDK